MTETLKKGDLIGVAYNNYIYPAIFVGEGIAQNPQFYRLQLRHIQTLQKGLIPYVGFINRKARTNANGRAPIVKVSAECLTKEQQGIYVMLKELLVKNGKL